MSASTGHHSSSLLQATLDATADGILVVDLRGRMTVFNARFLELWRLPRELVEAGDDEATIAAVLDQLADPRAFQARIQELYAHPAAESCDVLEFLDGRVFERFSAPQRLGGEIVGRVWSFRDVTERRHAEAAQSRSEQRFRETLENVSLVAASIDAGGVVTFANDFLLELTGWTRAEVVGHDWFERFDGDEHVRRDYFECMTRGEIRPHFESTLRTRRGELRTIRWSSTMQYDHAGAAAGIVTIGEDVTERRAAEEELRVREEHFRSLIENASDVICVLTPDGTSLYESPSVERMLGWKPEELVGRQNFAFRHPDDEAKVSASWAAILAGEETPPVELRLRHRDGSWRTVESVGRLRLQGGEPVVVLNYRDVTERRELEERLLHAQKLEAVGRLAGGVAHDFNNLLTAIGGFASLGQHIAVDGPTKDCFDQVASASERAPYTSSLHGERYFAFRNGLISSCFTVHFVSSQSSQV